MYIPAPPPLLAEIILFLCSNSQLIIGIRKLALSKIKEAHRNSYIYVYREDTQKVFFICQITKIYQMKKEKKKKYQTTKVRIL